MPGDNLKPLSAFLWGIARLELLHLLVAVVASMVIVATVPNIKSFDERPFPLVSTLTSDYDRLHKVAVPLVALNGVIAGLAFIATCMDLIRRKSLPLFVELSWTAVAFALELAALVLCGKSRFRVVQHIQGGNSAGLTGTDGNMFVQDAAAVITVSWEIMTMLTVTVTAFLTLHLLWHLVVGIRHLNIRPQVFTEPTPSYLWVLPTGTAMPDFQTVKVSEDAFAGKGDASGTSDISIQEKKLKQLS
ncbi:hypothetical protein FRC04_008770 [Tulasnella sp. 424]|nr:hypothetical protein FRC04_008770 [Tulasnella sp. 424]KAG8979999.1 hypothetical protein FRC05_007442 [Tulasnella sp. 425]